WRPPAPRATAVAASRHGLRRCRAWVRPAVPARGGGILRAGAGSGSQTAPTVRSEPSRGVGWASALGSGDQCIHIQVVASAGCLGAQVLFVFTGHLPGDWTA